MSIRDNVMDAMSEHAQQACINQHRLNIHTLYTLPNGIVYWGEEPSTSSWDVLAGTIDPVAVIYQTGTGSCNCNCDDCTLGHDPAGWAGDDADEMVDTLIRGAGEIEVGYFDDEDEDANDCE